MKRRYKVRWKGVKSLDLDLAGERSVERTYAYPREEQNMVRQPFILHVICIRRVPAIRALPIRRLVVNGM